MAGIFRNLGWDSVPAEVATECCWLQHKQNWLLVGCLLSGISVSFMPTTCRNSSCGAGCHDDRPVHTEQKDLPGQGVQYVTRKIVGGKNPMLFGIKHAAFGRIYLNYLKRQYLKTRTNASKSSACTYGLWFAFIFSLGRMVSNRWFFLYSNFSATKPLYFSVIWGLRRKPFRRWAYYHI